MAKIRGSFIDRIKSILQDAADELRPPDISFALDGAINIYNKDRPYHEIGEITGDNTNYDYSLPNDWDNNFSYIMGRIEYPADRYQDPPYLDDNSWTIYRSATGTYKLRFLTFTPSTGYVARFTYALPHTLNESTNTIYENDFEAVCQLAASLCFEALAAKYGQSTDSAVEAAVVDYLSKVELYKGLAEKALEKYNSHIGKGEETEERPAAVTFVDLDIEYPWNEDYLTHPKHQR